MTGHGSESWTVGLSRVPKLFQEEGIISEKGFLQAKGQNLLTTWPNYLLMLWVDLCSQKHMLKS